MLKNLRIKDLTGKIFGNFIVLKDSGKRKRRNVLWVCKCICGKEKLIRGGDLLYGDYSKSCGCIPIKKEENEDIKRTRISYNSMKSRCNPKTIDTNRQKYYISKNITYCTRWKNFNNFLEDMGIRPIGNTLDRIDNDKGYCKENCRWTSYSNQALNKKKSFIKNRTSIYKGVVKIPGVKKYYVIIKHKIVDKCLTEKEAAISYNKLIKKIYDDIIPLNRVV